MKTIRLTMTQAIVKYLSSQFIETEGGIQPIFAGVFAIFGHGNVAGIGQALNECQDKLPTYRGHSEQGMVHSAIAYAKANNRQRMMACTSSIGPGATNMVTAAALAHVNRLPVLLLPGDYFGSGTVGTGCILELRPENTGGWLKKGDVVKLEVEKLGILENTIK